jgi:hypothetical protein
MLPNLNLWSVLGVDLANYSSVLRLKDIRRFLHGLHLCDVEFRRQMFLFIEDLKIEANYNVLYHDSVTLNVHVNFYSQNLIPAMEAILIEGALPSVKHNPSSPQSVLAEDHLFVSEI